MREHPVETIGNSFLITRCWDHPRGRALKYKQLASLFCHLRNELTCAGACSDDGNFFTGEINIEIPSSRMERITLERINASDIGIIRSIQLPNSRHQNVRAVDTLGSGSVDRGHNPLLRVFIPNSRFNFGLEVDDGQQTKFFGTASEVLVQNLPRTEEKWPVVPLRETVAVHVVLNVNATTGIFVFQPRAADIIVLFKDGDRHSCLAKTMCRSNTRHPSTDNDR